MFWFLILGCYFIDVHFGGHQIQGSPFTVDVFDINKVNVDALSSSNIGEQAKFVGKDTLLLQIFFVSENIRKFSIALKVARRSQIYTKNYEIYFESEN